MVFIQGMQGWLNIQTLIIHYRSWLLKKTITSQKIIENAFDKIQYPFLIKHLGKLGIESFFNLIIKGIYKNPSANIILKVVLPKSKPKSKQNKKISDSFQVSSRENMELEEHIKDSMEMQLAKSRLQETVESVFQFLQ